MTETEYRQTAVYRLFDVECKLGGLMHHAVNANAYSKIKGVLKELNTLSPEDFAEDEDGNLIRDLLPLGRPVWIDRDQHQELTSIKNRNLKQKNNSK